MVKISIGPLVLGPATPLRGAAATLREGGLVEGCGAVLGIPLRVGSASG